MISAVDWLKAHHDCCSLPVRPKLNVKPSVVKPAMAVQLKPAPKRRGAQRSAVAAVKPLNSSSTVPQQDTVRSSTTPHIFGIPQKHSLKSFIRFNEKLNA